MLRRQTRPRSSKADNWGNDRCFGVAVINESVVAGDLSNPDPSPDRLTPMIADPTLPSVKSGEGRDYLYRTQIQQLASSVIVKRAIESNILTKALLPSKPHEL